MQEAMNLIHLKEAPKGTSAINLLRTALVKVAFIAAKSNS
jgi:hypothetical protein